MKETETAIEVSVSSQTGAISFVVSGKADRIKSAKRQLWSILAQNGTIEFEVPEGCLKFIIGPSGKIMKEIESTCSVRVKIPRGEDWKGSIMVSGDFEGVAMARDKILSIVQERVNQTTTQIEIDRYLAAFLWNSELSGLSQPELVESFPNVKIHLVKTPEGAHLSLSGNNDQIESIKGLIATALVRLRSSIKSVSTSVPKSFHRLLIGPKGSVLHQLEEETGCGISIPSSNDDQPEINEQVTIFGPEDKLLKGLSALMEKIRGLSVEKVQVSETPMKLLQHVQKYRNELKSFDPEASYHFNTTAGCIEVDGKKENVINFVGQLHKLLNELPSFKIQETLEVDQEYLKHVIGRKGHNLQQIQREFDVEILVEEDTTVCFIGKSAQSVKGALEHVNGILSSVVDVLSLTARIDSKYHGLLIGAKGSNLTQYHEKYPSVLINFKDDSVTFKGTRSEVEACHAELLAQADSIRHEMIMNSYTQTLKPVDEKLLKSSRDMAFLTNFARQNGCKLIVADGESDAITLQGSKKTVDQVFPQLKEQINLIQDRDSLTFSVDPQYHGVLIGAEGRNLKHLIQKYSVKIDFPKSLEESGGSEASEEASRIKITGPKANISKARDELLDLLKYHLDHNNQEIISVAAKVVPFIIGKNGSKIDSIKIETDCDVDILKNDKDSSEKDIKLSGTKESIKAAKKIIEEIVAEFADQIESQVDAPSSEFLKSLTNGTFKREYRKLTAKFEEVNFYAREAFIRVKGKKSLVAEAVEDLKNLINAIQGGQLIKIDLEIPSKIHGKILGSGGSNIKSLTGEFDCEIQIPRAGQSGPVTIVGPAEKAQKCSQKIASYCFEERLFKFPSSTLKSSIMAEIGSNNDNNNDNNNNNSEEDFFEGIEWKSQANGILLSGHVDKIEAVKERLNEMINNAKNKN